jgi:hypothetical protein
MHLLIAARVLRGLGGGGLMVPSQAPIGELVPPWDRPRYQGYFALIHHLQRRRPAARRRRAPPRLALAVPRQPAAGAFAFWRMSRAQAGALGGAPAPYDPAGACCSCCAPQRPGSRAGQPGAYWSRSPALFAAVARSPPASASARGSSARINAFLPLDILRCRACPGSVSPWWVAGGVFALFPGRSTCRWRGTQRLTPTCTAAAPGGLVAGSRSTAG